MTGESELAIKEAFQRAQKGHNNKAKLVASLKNTYNKLEDKTLFHEEFIQYLKHAMIVYKREPAVENVIEFVSKFSTSFHTPSAEGGEEEDEEEDENPFLSYMFNFLLESHKANSHAVRFRVCQLINKLLGSMAENAQIDDDLFDGIHQAMLVRVTDKFPNVRIQASLAMARLQEPQNHQCPTVNAYLLILENDSNPEVRRAVLSCIAPSSLTLPKILKRTRDVKESVRKLAYQVLSDKVHIRALSIAQRVSLLQQGLHDAAESVREVVQVRLLPAWLNLLQGDVLELLHKLDVENCSQTALDTLTALFTHTPQDQLLHHRLQLDDRYTHTHTALDTLTALFTHTPQDQLLHHRLQLDDRMLVPAGSLSCESVLYWRALCEFVKTKGDEGEEMLEKLLPEAATFAEYLYGYVKGLPVLSANQRNIATRYVKCVPVLSEEQKGDFAQLELVMTKEFISQQLIHLTGCLDTNEEGGRKRVVAVLQEMLVLPQTPPSLVSLLTEKLLTLIPDDHRRIQTVAEVISEVREPIVIRQPLDENENRRKQVKLAEVKVGILEAKQALEECISNQEFNRAAELKDSITDLENLRNNILQEENTQQDDKETETRMEKTDPETLLRCLTMCVELLKQMNIKTRIGPTMSAILSSLILPSISNAQPAVRNMAVVCLGTCALHSKDLVNTHLVLLLQIAQLDEAKIRISALRSVIDLLLLYGFTLLSERPSVAPQTSHSPANQEDQEKGEEPEEGSSTAQSILMMLSDFLDSEVSELRTETAEGLAKLMYSGRISSAKLLSRLVLLWYNPVTEDDTRLRHCLGVFFQLYARESRAHQECVEECFLPTLQTLLNAPATSPLAEVDVTNVAELLVELTRPSSLIKPGDTQEVCVHDYLAVRVCGEMLKDPSAPEVRLYAKVLNSLELSADGNTTRDLVTLLQQVTQEVKDRIALRAVEKLIGQLQDSNNQPDLSTTTLQPVDVNTEEAANQDLDQSAKRPRRGQRKPSTAKGAKKSSRSAESSEESDGENVPDSVPVPRPSRRAKTAALDKTRLDLSALINQEANTS
ncbi:condensin complex subunit 3 isoform X1 [Oncorhynchus kisutch]|uniref:Non-SMC condensin I complex, subunit G n=1 Tax=Oncorhynchus kisutch TaxID=8019 RepID=A0A8C7J209_ONCKI|nr:condensin complex subunit 3-like isoform X1 [Oncorhynchus kisutch]XP_031670718.1 condensin complex subunit 3-like isoform X1 [Oncorhynchus kisutch]XP_031670719.1 condensin complex subunit 3-like isoform X1 [Oncorhynchus kisutch]